MKEIALSQAGTIADRQLIIIDRNRDLYLLPVMKRNIAKLAAMCDSARWHDSTAMLTAMVDQRLVGDRVLDECLQLHGVRKAVSNPRRSRQLGKSQVSMWASARVEIGRGVRQTIGADGAARCCPFVLGSSWGLKAWGVGAGQETGLVAKLHRKQLEGLHVSCAVCISMRILASRVRAVCVVLPLGSVRGQGPAHEDPLHQS